MVSPVFKPYEGTFPLRSISCCTVPAPVSSERVPAQIISPASLKTHEMLPRQPDSLPLAARPQLSRSYQVLLTLYAQKHDPHFLPETQSDVLVSDSKLCDRKALNVFLAAGAYFFTAVIHQGASLLGTLLGRFMVCGLFILSTTKTHIQCFSHILEPSWAAAGPTNRAVLSSSLLEHHFQ